MTVVIVVVLVLLLLGGRGYGDTRLTGDPDVRLPEDE